MKKLLLKYLKKNKKYRKIIVRAIICAVILILGISAFIIFSSLQLKPKRKSDEHLIKTLITIPVKKENIREDVTGYGTTKPTKQICVSAQISGEIIYVMPNLRDGILVKKGKVLAKIEKEDYEIALKKAIADIRSNQSKLAVQKHEIKDNKTILETLKNKLRLAEADYNRQKQLFQKKVVSAQYFENSEEALNEQKQVYLKMKRDIAMSELELNSIKANIERAEAEQVQAELNIKRCDIKSPIDGRLENVTIEKDEYVTKGEKLFCIADDSALSIPVSLDIKDASAIMDVVSKKNNGYKHWFHYDKNTSVVIRWAEMPDKCVWEGEISRIEKFDPETRTVTVVVKPTKFIGKDNAILPLVAGMYCKVDLVGRELKNVVRIPWSALQLNGNVYVVDKNNIVHEKKVNVLSSREDNIIVSSGLNEGEKIITQRIPYGIVNGTKVKTETVK